MNETDWRNQALQDGYDDVISIHWAPGFFHEAHTHNFRANLFIISGSMVITTDDEEITCDAGDIRTLDAGLQHAELVGSDGVSFLLARKTG